MSHLFQRPLCDMGRAYDFAYRALLGPYDESSGGPCDDRPHRVELYSAETEPAQPNAAWQAFALCPDHEGQLAGYDARLVDRGAASRFRSAGSPPGAGTSRTR
jgi:hypothetical protein